MSVSTTFLTTTSAKLSSIPVVDGQVIALSDRDAWFYDMGSTRHSVSGQEYCTGVLPEIGYVNTLYVLSQAGEDSGIYIWDSNKFEKVAGNGKIYDAFVGATTLDGKSGLVPAPKVADGDKFLRGDGTWSNPVNTQYSVMSGATADANGSSGLVPAPTRTDIDKFLAGNGTWKSTPDTKNTAGSNQTSDMLYVVGAKAQEDSSETFSTDRVYIKSGKLYSNNRQVITTSDAQNLTNKTYDGHTLGDIVEKNVTDVIAKSNEDIPTSEVVYNAIQKVLNDAKEYTNSTIGDVVSFKVEVVDTLPAKGEEATIYLVPSETSSGNNVKTEYLYVDGEWEVIGSTQIDLSAYSTTEEVEAAINDALTNYVPKSDLNNYVKKSELETEATKSLPPVATSGSYNDLKDKPKIPTKFSDLVQDKVLLVDDVTGVTYQLGVSNGKICITEVE